ncbi:MAG TPA: undecaprenyl-diphosphate phosphatase [Dissulfurispiraceae bacterium]|nr:undecaprenyl-diphosphate phosphatase [Dissulfurispiraceae bacterium]
MSNELIQAIILGLLQGITEFFPISSTAHLILMPWLFGWSGQIDTLTFNVAVHGGTLLALLVCFYRDWIDMLLHDRKMLFTIFAAIIPAGVAGILFHDIIEHTLRHPLVIAASLIIFGALMLVAERTGKQAKRNVTFLNAMIIGCAQAVALIPGTSRSGITITAGLFMNLKRETVARFSFLLSTPVIAGATLLECKKLFKTPADYQLDLFAAGFIAAFISGIFAIKFLMAYLKKHPLNAFAYYRFLLAGGILILYFTRI